MPSAPAGGACGEAPAEGAGDEPGSAGGSGHADTTGTGGTDAPGENTAPGEDGAPDAAGEPDVAGEPDAEGEPDAAGAPDGHAEAGGAPDGPTEAGGVANVQPGPPSDPHAETATDTTVASRSRTNLGGLFINLIRRQCHMRASKSCENAVHGHCDSAILLLTGRNEPVTNN